MRSFSLAGPVTSGLAPLTFDSSVQPLSLPLTPSSLTKLCVPSICLPGRHIVTLSLCRMNDVLYSHGRAFPEPFPAISPTLLTAHFPPGGPTSLSTMLVELDGLRASPVLWLWLSMLKSQVYKIFFAGPACHWRETFPSLFRLDVLLKFPCSHLISVEPHESMPGSCHVLRIHVAKLNILPDISPITGFQLSGKSEATIHLHLDAQYGTWRACSFWTGLFQTA